MQCIGNCVLLTSLLLSLLSLLQSAYAEDKYLSASPLGYKTGMLISRQYFENALRALQWNHVGLPDEMIYVSSAVTVDNNATIRGEFDDQDQSAVSFTAKYSVYSIGVAPDGKVIQRFKYDGWAVLTVAVLRTADNRYLAKVTPTEAPSGTPELPLPILSLLSAAFTTGAVRRKIGIKGASGLKEILPKTIDRLTRHSTLPVKEHG